MLRTPKQTTPQIVSYSSEPAAEQSWLRIVEYFDQVEKPRDIGEGPIKRWFNTQTGSELGHCGALSAPITNFSKGQYMGRDLLYLLSTQGILTTALLNNFICIYIRFILLNTNSAFQEGFKGFLREIESKPDQTINFRGQSLAHSALFKIVRETLHPESPYVSEITKLCRDPQAVYGPYKTLSDLSSIIIHNGPESVKFSWSDIIDLLLLEECSIRIQILNHTLQKLCATLGLTASSVSATPEDWMRQIFKQKESLEKEPLSLCYFDAFTGARGGGSVTCTTKEYLRAHLALVTGLTLVKRGKIKSKENDSSFASSLAQIFLAYVQKFGESKHDIIILPSVESHASAEEAKSPAPDAVAVAKPVTEGERSRDRILINNLFCLYCVFVMRPGETDSSNIQLELINHICLGSESSARTVIPGLGWDQLLPLFQKWFTRNTAYVTDEMFYCDTHVNPKTITRRKPPVDDQAYIKDRIDALISSLPPRPMHATAFLDGHPGTPPREDAALTSPTVSKG